MNSFLNLPLWARLVLGVLGITILGVLLLVAASLSKEAFFVLAGGLVAVAGLVGLYIFVLRLLNRRRGAGISRALGRHNAAGDGRISEAAKRAQLDDMRQQFEEGVQRFRDAGKDLYSIPWYVVVGEPGSGKTEAVRHSNVGFPPGLQDELQGTGGTINMNWWFTNQAVFLDTAGRLIFEEVEPGSTSEWQEFLKLLRRVRPYCPINGMILAIPADTLIKDTPSGLEGKARKLASQLTDIQRALDIRFPVFVLVTKSDLVPGFREFFENIHDPQLQHQLVGWSNPAELDEPFKAEDLDQHLEPCLEAMHRRRLGLLQDPTPLQSGSKRLDEVDSLFTYPSALKSLFPRLRRYLEMIFASHEWSQKQLFLRGIYFTSSMQEGSALDEELAQALAVPLDSLPEGRVWEKERAYFLRDACMEKIFKESRLVTRATNARKQLRRRQAALIWTGIAALLCLAGFSWYSANALRQSIGDQLVYWKYAADPESVSSDAFFPPVVYEGRDAGTYFNNAEGIINLRHEEFTVESFHRRLRTLAEREIQVPWIFRMLRMGGVEQDRRLQAQRVAFEAHVLEPLIRLARGRLGRMDVESWTDEATGVLRILLQLEQESAAQAMGESGFQLERADILDPLMRFLTGTGVGAELPRVLERTYFETAGSGAETAWPPAWVSGGRTLRENTAIAHGMQVFLAHLAKSHESRIRGLESAALLEEEFTELAILEAELLEAAGRVDSPLAFDSLLRIYDRYRIRLDRANATMETWLAAVGVETARRQSLAEASGELIASLRRGYEAQLELLGGVLDPALEGQDLPLLGQVRHAIEQERRRFQDRLDDGLPPSTLERLKVYDEQYLDTRRTRESYSYRARAELYDAVLREVPGLFGVRPLPGELAETLEALIQRMEVIRFELADFRGGLQQQMRSSLEGVLDYWERVGLTRVSRVLLEEGDRWFRQQIGFPLVLERGARTLSVGDVREFRRRVEGLDRDMASPVFQRIPRAEADQIRAFHERLRPVYRVARELVSADGMVGMAEITFPSESIQRSQLEAWFPEHPFNALYGGRNFRDLEMGDSGRVRSFQAVSRRLGHIPLDAEVLRLEFFQNAGESVPQEVYQLQGAWAPLRAILELRTVLPEGGGNGWRILVDLPTHGPSPVLFVLSMELPAGLPELGNWPTRRSLGLD